MRRAQERIGMAADSSIAFIEQVRDDESLPINVRLDAAKDLANRASLTGKTTIELEVPAWQRLVDRIIVDTPTDVVDAEVVADPEYDRAAVFLEADDSQPLSLPPAPVAPEVVADTRPTRSVRDRLSVRRPR
jgi:hypothetical protein